MGLNISLRAACFALIFILSAVTAFAVEDSGFLKYVHEFKFDKALNAWKNLRKDIGADSAHPLYFNVSDYFPKPSDDFSGPDPFKAEKLEKYVEKGLLKVIKKVDYRDMLFKDIVPDYQLIDTFIKRKSDTEGKSDIKREADLKGISDKTNIDGQSPALPVNGDNERVLLVTNMARALFSAGYFSESRDVFNRLLSENDTALTTDDMRMYAMARRIDHYLANALANAQIMLARNSYMDLESLCESCIYFSRTISWPDYFLACSFYDQKDYMKAGYQLDKLAAGKNGYSNVRLLDMSIQIHLSNDEHDKALQIIEQTLKRYYSDFLEILEKRRADLDVSTEKSKGLLSSEQIFREDPALKTSVLDFCKDHNLRLEDLENLLFRRCLCINKNTLINKNSISKKNSEATDRIDPNLILSLRDYQGFISLFDDKSSFSFIKDAALITGDHYFSCGDYRAALAAYDTAADYNAFPKEYVLKRAKCSLRLNDHEAGLEDLITASATELDSAEVRQLAAVELMDPGNDSFNPEAALKHAVKACEFSEYSDYGCLLTLSMAYYKNDDTDKAREVYKKAQNVNSEKKAARFLEKLLYKKGSTKGSKKGR